MKTANQKNNKTATKALLLATLLGFAQPSNTVAQVTFDGIEYNSMSEALTAINGTVDPEWFTPERRQALGDVLSDIAARLVGNLSNLAITSRAPGGAYGGEAAGAILNDRIEWLTRAAIEYARTRPDNRPRIEQLMEEADVAYFDIDPEPFLYRGPEGYFEYERAFLNHIQNQLTLQAASKGQSTIPNAWLAAEIWKLDTALRDLRTLAQEPLPPIIEDDPDFCLTTEQQLFDHFLSISDGGIMFANNSVIAVSKASTTEPLGQNDPNAPYEFRIRDLELCDALREGQINPEIGLSDAVQGRISEAVSYACMGEGGDMSNASVYIHDLDGDGEKDLILDHGGLTCSNGMNISCGAQVCTSEIFLQRDGSLEEVVEILNGITGISSDPIPLIGVWGHGGTQGQIRWNGQAFVPF